MLSFLFWNLNRNNWDERSAWLQTRITRLVRHYDLDILVFIESGFQPAVVTGEARFLRSSTIYARTGDVFAYASVLFTLGALALSRRRVE